MGLSKRLGVSLIAGAVLGVFCIVGMSIRLAAVLSALDLLAMWYNRLLIGLVIGVAGELRLIPGKANRYLRGAVLGFLVGLGIFLSTGLTNVLSLLAGIVYGMIIEWAAARYGRAKGG